MQYEEAVKRQVAHDNLVASWVNLKDAATPYALSRFALRSMLVGATVLIGRRYLIHKIKGDWNA